MLPAVVRDGTKIGSNAKAAKNIVRNVNGIDAIDAPMGLGRMNNEKNNAGLVNKVV